MLRPAWGRVRLPHQQESEDCLSNSCSGSEARGMSLPGRFAEVTFELLGSGQPDTDDPCHEQGQPAPPAGALHGVAGGAAGVAEAAAAGFGSPGTTVNGSCFSMARPESASRTWRISS